MSRLLAVATCVAAVAVISAPAAYSVSTEAASRSSIAATATTYDAPNFDEICRLRQTGRATFSLSCGTGSMGRMTIHGRASCSNEWNVAAPARTADLEIWADKGGYVTGRCPKGYRLISLDGIHKS